MNSNSWYYNDFFLLQDAMHSAVLTQYSVCLSVCLSATHIRQAYRYRAHIGWIWNSSKIISRPNSLRLIRWLTPTWAIWCNGKTPKLW